ncbi:MAG: choice-of-anchor D domain-containing protein [Chloroflexota bacterium]
MHSSRSHSRAVALLVMAMTLFTLVGSATPAAALVSQPARRSLPAAQADTPALTISPAAWDFGSVLVGESSEPKEFTLANNSDTDFVVDEVGFFVTATNHFRIVTGSSDQCSGQALPSHGSCTFQVTFTPQSSGPRTTTLGVQLEGAEVPLPKPASLLSGSAPMPSLRITPTSDLFDFGDVAVGGTPGSQRFTISNDGEAGSVLKVVGITIVYADAGFTQVDGALPVALGIDDDPFEFHVEFDPPDAGAHRAMMYIAATGLGVVAVALIGNGIAPALSLTPSSHDFGDVAVGASRSKVFTASNTGSAGLTGLGIDVTGDDLAIVAGDSDCDDQTSLDPGATCVIKLRYAPDELGADDGSLKVTADGALVDTSTIEGTGVAQDDSDDPDPAIVGVSPDEWDFGSIEVGTTDSKELTVRNTGDQPLTGLALSVSGVFSIASDDGTCDDSGTLAADESCTVRVIFEPGSVGAKSGTLKVQSSNAANGTVNVPLTGIATPHPSDVSVTPASADLGHVVFAGVRTRRFTVTNSGGTPVTITGVTRTGSRTYTVIEADDECANETLGEGESCTFRVRFQAPASTAGAKNATVHVTGDFDEILVPLTATAEPFQAKVDAFVTAKSDKPSKYVGIGVFCRSSCWQQQAERTVGRGATFTYRVRVRNSGNGVDDIRVRLYQTNSKSSIRKVEVLRNGNQDVTSRVTNGSYVARDVNPGAEIYFWVRVSVAAHAPSDRVNTILISGQSTRTPKVKDVVRTKTTVR